MSFVKTSYDDEIRNFLKSNYDIISSPIDEDDYTERMTLKEIYRMVTCVLPKQYIYEGDIYEALIDLGYKVFPYTMPAKYDEEGKEIYPEQTIYAYSLRKKTAAI